MVGGVLFIAYSHCALIRRAKNKNETTCTVVSFLYNKVIFLINQNLLTLYTAKCNTLYNVFG